MPLKVAKYCAVPVCRRTQSLHNLPSDPNIRNAWLNFVFKEVPDHVNKTLSICSLHFTEDSFINKTQFNAGFAERLRLKNGAVPSIFDPTRTAKHTSVSKYHIYCHYCFATDRLICTDSCTVRCSLSQNRLLLFVSVNQTSD